MSLGHVLVACALTLGAGACAGAPAGPPPSPAARASPTAQPPPQSAVVAPLLTASDGSGLRVTSIAARAVMDEPLAYTELRLVLENPTDAEREGTFRLALPGARSLVRFAMRLGFEWKEAQAVPLSRARSAFESIVHQRRDPALIELSLGNEWSVRIFPLAPREKREVIVSYAEDLVGSAYTLPLSTLPGAGTHADVRVVSARGDTLAEHARWPPGEDLRVARRHQSLDGLRDDAFALMVLRPKLASVPSPFSGTILSIDTSASQSALFPSSCAIVQRLAEAIGNQNPAEALAIVAFDQTAELLYDGPATGHASAVSALLRRGALGASSRAPLSKLLAKLVASGKFSRLVSIGDGVTSAFRTTDGGATSTFPSARLRRADAISVGAVRDDEALKALVHDGAVIDGADTWDVVWRKLTTMPAALPVHVDGAHDWYPKAFTGVFPGDELHLFAKVAATDRPRVTLGAMAIAPRLQRGNGPLLELAWARAKMTHLLATPREATRPALVDEVAAFAGKHQLPSPYTGLLLLEADDDFDHYDITRAETKRVLHVDGNQLVVTERKRPPRPLPREASGPDVPSSPWGRIRGVDEPFPAAGHLWGSGALPPVASPAAATGSSVAPSAPSRGKLNTGSDVTVFGHISPEAVRQVVRPALGTLRRCYDVGLATDAHLEGRVVVAFEIDGTGRVRNARDQGSVLPSRSVVDCVVTAFQKLRFPHPSGGPVRVVYPVFFAREASATPAADARPSPSLDVAAERWRSIEKTRSGGDLASAARASEAWHTEAPTDVLALLALGESAERTSRRERAARAYGSLLDVCPNSPSLTSHGATRLARLDDDHALALAIDAYRQALLERPNHPSRHRLLAYALHKQGATSEAFDALLTAVRVDFPEDGFPGAKRLLKEDLGLIGEALMRRAPSRQAELLETLAKAGVTRESSPSIRVVLSWESDLSNLDLELGSPSGTSTAGESYGDVTSGYGPEAWVLRNTSAGSRKHDGYAVGVRFVRRGPGGYAMGVAQTVEHDGRGALRVSERPFVLTAEGERASLGTVGRQPTAD